MTNKNKYNSLSMGEFKGRTIQALEDIKDRQKETERRVTKLLDGHEIRINTLEDQAGFVKGVQWVITGILSIAGGIFGSWLKK